VADDSLKVEATAAIIDYSCSVFEGCADRWPWSRTGAVRVWRFYSGIVVRKVWLANASCRWMLSTS